MSSNRKHGALLRWSAAIAALSAVSAPAASAKPLEFVYTGTFSSADSLNSLGAATDPFPNSTPFSATAFFDDSSPNLVSALPFPGFVAYSPTSATLTVGRDTFNFATSAQNPTQGVSVAIFDGTTPFGPPGHYAAGLVQNPVADGAGFVGDFLSASPTFSAAHLTPTNFTGYFGVGFGSGPETFQGSGVNTVVPIPLTDAQGHNFVLTLGNYDEQAAVGVQNTANILAVPVPEMSPMISFGILAALGLGGAVVARKKSRA